MGFRDKIKKNTPRVELHSINSLIAGGYKSGKTRLWKEVTEIHYNEHLEDALLVAFEGGYETWELDNVIPLHQEGEDWEIWDCFRKDVVKGLVEEAKAGRKVKLIGIDTADRAIDACTAWLIRNANKKYAKNFTSLQEISTQTDENGWTLLYEELKRQFDALWNVGYRTVSLAWTKEKETTLYDGKKYNSVELMMNNTARKVFESQASLICCLFNEVRILDKEGNELEENIKDKKGKEKAANFHETETMIYFRPSQYVSIAGGRFTNLPEKVPYSAENFLKVFEEAVKGQLKNPDKIEEIRQEQATVIEQKAQEFIQKEETRVEEVTPQQVISEIKQFVDAMKPVTQEFKDKCSEIFKRNLGLSNYTKSNDAVALSKCFDEMKQM